MDRLNEPFKRSYQIVNSIMLLHWVTWSRNTGVYNLQAHHAGSVSEPGVLLRLLSPREFVVDRIS